MSSLHHATVQRNLIIRLTITAIIIWLIVIGSLIATRTDHAGLPERFEEQVLPGLADKIGEISEIRFTMADGSYALAREGDIWTMVTADSYPVSAAPLAQFLTGLVGLTYQGRQTRDPKKYGIIGLGSPQEGGNGVRLQIYTQAEAELVNLVIGRTPSGLYLRKGGEETSYQVNGNLPPFYNQRPWLDLDIYDLDADMISLLSASRPGQAATILLQTGLSPAFNQEATNFRQTVRPGRIAQSIADLAFIDVQGSDRLTGPARIYFQIITETGLSLDLAVYSEANGAWVTIQASGSNDQSVNQAAHINRRAANWAFAISGYSFSTLNATLPQ